MDWGNYQKRFKISAKKRNLPDSFISECLDYAKKLYDNKVPIIFDTEHLSLLLGCKIQFLYKITNNLNKNYRIYKIPKHNGKMRTITEPYSDLKNIQQWILVNILQKMPVSIYAKAYISNTSLKSNVRFHVKQPVIIKLDVQDFFPSIHQISLVKLFRKYGYELNLSRMLSRLCTYEGVLPQGAPTSPYISNLYCRRIDNRIGKYITNAGFRYTRYSDDITISGNISDKQIGTIIQFCRKCLAEEGLKLNEGKTQILRSHHRQLVTGVILNQKISAGTKKKKDIRKQVYFIKKYGLESHIEHEKIEKQNYIYHLAGLINWVLFLENNNKEFLEYKTFVNEIIKQINS